MLTADVADLAGGAVALAGDREAVLAGDHDLASRHLVQGQGAGLVRADGRGRPQGLDRRQALDDRVPPCDLAGTHRQEGGDHRGQTRRDRRDSQGDAGDEQGVEGLAPGQAEQYDEHQRDGGDRGDDLAQAVQLLLQRSLAGLGAGQHVGDVPDLGGHARRCHDQLPAATRDRGVHVRHAGPVPQGDLVPEHRLHGLAHRQALPGQGGFLDLERGGHIDAGVGRHPVACLHQDHVAWNELVGVDLDALPVPTYPRDGPHHLSQCLDTLLGLGLLTQSDHGVEDGQAGQDNRGPGLPGHDLVHRRGHQEHHLHEVLVLAQEGAIPRLGLAFGEPVGAGRRQPLLHLCGRQSLLGVDAQGVRDDRHLGSNRVDCSRCCVQVGVTGRHGRLLRRGDRFWYASACPSSDRVGWSHLTLGGVGSPSRGWATIQRYSPFGPAGCWGRARIVAKRRGCTTVSAGLADPRAAATRSGVVRTTDAPWHRPPQTLTRPWERPTAPDVREAR